MPANSPSPRRWLSLEITASAAGPIENGTYKVEMPPGEKCVQISAMKVVGRRQVYEGDPNSPVVDDVREMIPPQYNAASTLTVSAAAMLRRASVRCAPTYSGASP